MQRTELMLAHETSHAVLTSRFAGFPDDVQKHAWRSIEPMASNKRGADQPQKPSVLLGVVGEGLLQPVVVAALRDAEQAAHLLDAVLLPMGLDERIDRPNSSFCRLRGHGVDLQ